MKVDDGNHVSTWCCFSDARNLLVNFAVYFFVPLVYCQRMDFIKATYQTYLSLSRVHVVNPMASSGTSTEASCKCSWNLIGSSPEAISYYWKILKETGRTIILDEIQQSPNNKDSDNSLYTRSFRYEWVLNKRLVVLKTIECSGRRWEVNEVGGGWQVANEINIEKKLRFARL